MSLEAGVSFFIAVFIFSITPGPGVFAIIARALVNGPKSCFWLSLGMTISDILYLIAACFGLAAIATHWGEVFLIIRIAGALYLFYLGWKMWTATVDFNNTSAKVENPGHGLNFLQGFAISASNPKVILFYIAFLPTFMDLSALTGSEITLAAFLTLVSLMMGLSCIAWFAGAARQFFTSERSAKRLNRSAGSIMISAGAFLLLKSS
jgi:threonine/homoserine/homoserine lactone efflux protein